MDVAATVEHPTSGEVGTSNGNTSTLEDNKFQRAISAWRSIDLTNLIPKLDTTASELATQQKDSLVERKELAQKTKDFRKLDDEAKVTEVKALLKCTLIAHRVDNVMNPLTYILCSISDIYRPRIQSLQIHLFSIPPSLLSSFRSSRSIPFARSLYRIFNSGR